MTDEAFEDLGRGVRKLRAEVHAWALSPDDLWLAVCSAGALRVVECETGREVMTVQGRGASGVAARTRAERWSTPRAGPTRPARS